MLISAVSLALVFYLANPSRLLEALRLANYRLAALGMSITLLWSVVRAFAWRTLLKNRPTVKQTFFTINQGLMLNNILPFRLGEVGRCFLMSEKTNLGFWEVFSTILIERILDVAFAAGLLMATLPFVVGAAWAYPAAIVAGLLVVTGLGGMYLLARNRVRATALFERLFARWPALNRLGGSRLASFLNGLGVLTDGALFLKVLGWMTLDWAIAVVQYLVLLWAFFPEAKLLWAAFTLGAAALGIAAPSSPGAVGVYELTVVAALSIFGLEASTALAFALTAHMINYILTGILGAIGLMQDGETLAGLYHRIRRLPNAAPGDGIPN